MNKLLPTWQAATFQRRRAGFTLLFSTALLACGSSHAEPAVTAPPRELERVAAQTCENGVMARSKNKSSLDFHQSGSVAKCVLSADGKKVVVIDIEDASPRGM